jgi:hypothetical protein
MTSTWRADMIARGRAGHYATNHVQVDRRRLMRVTTYLGFIKSHDYGTDAEIQPRDSSYAFPKDSLRNGFIAARIITNGNGDYPKYHLPERDTIYVFVRYRAGIDSSAYFIPTQRGPIGAGHVYYELNNGTYGSRLSLAKWLFDWNDEMAWMTCEDGGCCRIR